MKREKTFLYINYFKKNKSNKFLFVLCLFIAFFVSIALNTVNMQFTINQMKYYDFPSGYSSFINLNEQNVEVFLQTNFSSMKRQLYFSTKNATTSLLSAKTKVNIVGCSENFEKFPIISNYTNDSLTTSHIISGHSFDTADIVTASSAMIMYESQLAKIGFQSGDSLMIAGQNFKLKGVLADSNEVLRNQNQDTVQIFIPKTTFKNLFRNYMTTAVIETGEYTFADFDTNTNFMSKFKIDRDRENSKKYLNQILIYTVVALMIISCVATAIVQTLILRNRHPEIGIRRAIGASQDSIIFMFVFNSSAIILFGMIIGIVASVFTLLTMASVLSARYFANLFIFSFNEYFILMALFYAASFISVLLPSVAGSHINISSILVEER